MPAALARSLRNQPFTTVPLLGFRLCGDGVNWLLPIGDRAGMGYLGAFVGSRRSARLVVLGAGCLVLANCSGGAGRIDPRYGVAASARVVEPGQPVPKGGGLRVNYLTGQLAELEGKAKMC